MIRQTQRVRSQELTPYAGQWVALAAGRVMGHHKLLTALRQKTKDQSKKKNISYFRVPRNDEGPYILIVQS